MGKLIVSLVNSHTNAARIGWHLWEIDLRFAPGLSPGWWGYSKDGVVEFVPVTGECWSRVSEKSLRYVTSHPGGQGEESPA